MSTQQPTNSRLTAFTILALLILAFIGLGSRFWVAYEGKQDLKEIRQAMEEAEKADAEFRKEMAKPSADEE